MKRRALLGLAALVAATLAACSTPSTGFTEDEFDGQEFVFQSREAGTGLSAQADGDIPSLRVRIGVKTRTNASSTREKVASAVFKWADADTTLTGPVTLVIREKGAVTGSLGTNTATVTSNSTLDAGAGYTGNTAFATPQSALTTLCVDATWNLTTGTNGYNFNQANTVTYCQKNPPTAIADLALRPALTSPTVAVNSDGVLTIPVQNSGSSTAINVNVGVTIPTGVSYLSAVGSSWVCVPNTATATSQLVTCALATFSKSTKNLALNIKGITDNVNPYNISATVSSPTIDPISSNNTRSYSVLVSQAAAPTPTSDLSAKFQTIPSTTIPTVGTAIPLNLTITNLGPTNKAAGRTIELVRSSTLTYNSATVNGLAGSCTDAAGVTTCTLPAIASNQSAVIAISVTPSSTGIKGLTAALAASADDPSNSNNTDSISFTAQ